VPIGFPFNDDSPALEVATVVLKVVFDPKSEISAERVADTFASIAIGPARGTHMQGRN
jgi:hypothetical protein